LKATREKFLVFKKTTHTKITIITNFSSETKKQWNDIQNIERSVGVGRGQLTRNSILIKSTLSK
jgi:hypothetical protein